ncbi:hypothetical protein NDU88_006583 [Pleurodeles waltl]|uniref:Uncharacterized protein n=1 Tax=Pleurodeles waltl TaxID=8319 RepID=A0AAV7MDU7_PLEWA|nr:hypothetical protein NDU88_006583 [Pleurodeles waltl]
MLTASLWKSDAKGCACDSSRRNGREARERGSSPAVGPTSILCTLDPLVLRSVSPLEIRGPGLWKAPQGLPDWVPPSLRETVFWSRRRGSALSVGHFPAFPSKASCRPVRSRLPVVEVRVGSLRLWEGFDMR